MSPLQLFCMISLNFPLLFIFIRLYKDSCAPGFINLIREYRTVFFFSVTKIFWQLPFSQIRLQIFTDRLLVSSRDSKGYDSLSVYQSARRKKPTKWNEESTLAHHQFDRSHTALQKYKRNKTTVWRIALCATVEKILFSGLSFANNYVESNPLDLLRLHTLHNKDLEKRIFSLIHGELFL
jgi:hypothetical protein